MRLARAVVGCLLVVPACIQAAPAVAASRVPAHQETDVAMPTTVAKPRGGAGAVGAGGPCLGFGLAVGVRLTPPYATVGSAPRVVVDMRPQWAAHPTPRLISAGPMVGRTGRGSQHTVRPPQSAVRAVQLEQMDRHPTARRRRVRSRLGAVALRRAVALPSDRYSEACHRR